MAGGTEVSVTAAFAGGLGSFLSPCFFPLIPGYLSTVGATGVGETTDKLRVFKSALLFSLGFSIVFVVLGVSVGAISEALRVSRHDLEVASGIIMVVFAVLLLASLHPKVGAVLSPRNLWLERARSAGSFVFGGAFALGWTPCITPALGAILALAANGGRPLEGALYLAVYAAGLSVPFLLAALLGEGALRWLRGRRTVIRMLWILSVALLAAVGALLVTGRFTQLGASI